jgi:hypothetical protein
MYTLLHVFCEVCWFKMLISCAILTDYYTPVMPVLRILPNPTAQNNKSKSEFRNEPNHLRCRNDMQEGYTQMDTCAQTSPLKNAQLTLSARDFLAVTRAASLSDSDTIHPHTLPAPAAAAAAADTARHCPQPGSSMCPYACNYFPIGY